MVASWGGVDDHRQLDVAELPDDGAIVLDVGTTTRSVGSMSASCPPLEPDRDDPRGRVHGRTVAAVGDWAIAALATIHVDVAFMATNGISVERGLTTPDPTEAVIKAATPPAHRNTRQDDGLRNGARNDAARQRDGGGHHGLAVAARVPGIPKLCRHIIDRRLGDSDAWTMVVAVPTCDPRCYPTSENLIGRPATMQDDDLENSTHVRAVSDGGRRGVSDYGSEGWGFESLRAR